MPSIRAVKRDEAQQRVGRLRSQRIERQLVEMARAGRVSSFMREISQ